MPDPGEFEIGSPATCLSAFGRKIPTIFRSSNRWRGREIEMKINMPKVTAIPMKKIPALAGLAVGFVALKCPICLLALTGLTASIGSLMPAFYGVYQVIITGLGILFMWFLYRALKDRTIPAWVVILGSLGFVGLIVQLLGERNNVIGLLSALMLSAASVTSFIIKEQNSRNFPPFL